MAKVVLTYSFARQFAGGKTEHEVSGQSIRHLVRALDERFPGIGDRLNEDMAVAIDGVIHQNAFLEKIAPDSEVCFIPALQGG
ncbi:MAG: MoaD/ThiS family protein [Alphaproteobacteria bacterium]|nr:MoaD/ThiS family protein [Alphaproteobacteria bacterium]